VKRRAIRTIVTRTYALAEEIELIRRTIRMRMADTYEIGMFLMHFGTPRDQEARAELAAALPEGKVGEPDDVGVFEIELEAEDQEDALQKVWNAVAASGTDDHIVFLEHPSLPEHWRRVSGGPS
jgi:hypothetical protein